MGPDCHLIFRRMLCMFDGPRGPTMMSRERFYEYAFSRDGKEMHVLVRAWSADEAQAHVGQMLEAQGIAPHARLVERRPETEDRRQRTVRLTHRGQAFLRLVDRARADQFLSAVRPLPSAERALVAMGVAALATHAISRRGRLIRTPHE